MRPAAMVLSAIASALMVLGFVGAPAANAAPAKATVRAKVALPWLSYASRDMHGYRHSLYTGKYFEAGREEYRLCVIQRESGGQYDLSGSYQGAYQFGSFWHDSLLSKLDPEMRSTYGSAWTRVKATLSGRSIHSWPRFFQDAAFWTVLNHGAGASNWYYAGGYSCDSTPRAYSRGTFPSADRYNYSPIEGR